MISHIAKKNDTFFKHRRTKMEEEIYRLHKLCEILVKIKTILKTYSVDSIWSKTERKDFFFVLYIVSRWSKNSKERKSGKNSAFLFRYFHLFRFTCVLRIVSAPSTKQKKT